MPRMRLEAEMKDNASPAIRKLRQELADLQAQTAEVRGVAKLNKEIAALRKESGDVRATAGMKAFNAWMDEARGQASGFLGSIKEIPGILGAVGIGGIAAGASVSALASEMKKLGEQGLAMKELSRQTGLSLDFVNRWSHAGEHFAVTGDAMRGMLDRFAGQLPDFNRGVGSMYKEFSIWPDVVRKMRSENPADALMDALRQIEEVGRVKGPQVQKQLLDAMGLGDEAEKLFGEGGLAGLQAQLNKPWATPSQELTKQALALRDATSEFNNGVVKLENTIGPDFLKVMTAGIHGLEVVVEDLGKTFKWVHDFFAQDAKDWDKSHVLGGRFGMAPSSIQPAPDGAKSLMPRNQPAPETYHYHRNDGHSLLNKESYDGSGFGGLLQHTSFTQGGTGSGTIEGAISEGSKAGVLQAFREIAIEQDIKRRVSTFDGDGAGESGGADGDGAGSRSFLSGRQGFMARKGHFGGRRGFGARNGGDDDLSDGRVDKFHSGKLFHEKAPQVMARLERDLGLSETEAAAVLGNLGHESAGFKAFAEGGNGPGRGWAQWTDPGRKRRFFEYAQKNKLDPKSDEANYGFLRWELTHTHKAAIAALKHAGTPEEKMMAFERLFEGAGVKAYGSRMRYMRQALAAAHAHPQNADADPSKKSAEGGLAAASRRSSANPLRAPPNPNAGRRASGDLSGRRPQGESAGSDHRLTISLHDPGSHVKSTRLERNGPLQVEMPNRWRTQQSPLIAT